MGTKVFAMVLWLALSSTVALADVPGQMSYQGTLTDLSGVAVDTTVGMDFTLYEDSLGVSALWTESQPAVEVTSGVFNVLLGSQNPLAKEIFSGAPLWLGIAVGADPEIEPRQKIATVGYAFRAAEADTADFVRGGGASDGDWVISGSDMYAGVSGNVGIGTTTPHSKLSLGTDFNPKKFALWDGVDDFYGLGADLGRIIFCTNNSEKMTIYNSGNVGIGTWLPLQKLHLLEDHEPVSLRIEDWGNIYYDLTTDSMALKISSTLHSDVLVLQSGNVGVGTTDPDAKLTVAGPTNGMALAKVNQTGTRAYMGLRLDRNDAEKWLVGMDQVNEKLIFRRKASSNDMAIDTLGNVGIATTNPSQKLDIDWGNIIVQGTGSCDASGEEGIVYLGTVHHYIKGVYGFGVKIGTYAVGDSALTIRELSGKVGIGTTTPDERLHVRGTVKCDVLKLTGGADIAEPFAVAAAPALQPGTVLTIDPDRPGALKIAEQAYDCCVAGIVSGAGHIEPGLIMSRSENPQPGEHPVALTGRVYCWADASYGSIRPGDLLTTSDTPGHAMKASDHDRAQGAVLGKAMSSLEAGRGLVLVLVSLQ